MDYIKTFEMYNNLQDLEKMDNDYNVSDNQWFFLRVTNSPYEDLERGFSCHAGCWVDDYEEALDRQDIVGALIKPLQDPKTKSWCYDPELGLSGYGFNNKKRYETCCDDIKNYIEFSDDKVYVFTSKNFRLSAGIDSEDLFTNGKLIGKLTYTITNEDDIEIHESYQDILNMAKKQ